MVPKYCAITLYGSESISGYGLSIIIPLDVGWVSVNDTLRGCRQTCIQDILCLFLPVCVLFPISQFMPANTPMQGAYIPQYAHMPTTAVSVEVRLSVFAL